MSKRKSPSDYHQLAQKKAITWLGPEVPNSHTKTEWKCRDKHTWFATFGSIRNGSGCPKCANARRKALLTHAPSKYHELANKQGYIWSGPVVTSANSKTGWKCMQGHSWKARYGSIQQGRGCPVCAGNLPKTNQDYKILADEKGFTWVGPEVANTNTKTNWKCAKGHQWGATFGSINNTGSGCPDCAGVRRKTSEDYLELGKAKGCKWLGPEVQNNRMKTKWECILGHQWDATYHDFQQSTGCPTCARERSAGKKRHKSTDYETLASQQGFEWLGPEVQNAHAKTKWKCEFGHIWEANFNNIRTGYGCPDCAGRTPKNRKDYLDLANKRGFQWLGPEVPNTKSLTNWECQHGHKWPARFNDISKGIGCPTCATEKSAELLRHNPSDYMNLAEINGFKWIGPDVSSTKEKTKWECGAGHRWEARYNDILRGSGCPICVDVINGARVSQPQRKLCELLNGELNKKVGSYNIDIALKVETTEIAIEYDSWYWHGHRQDYDNKRDEVLCSKGWRILRVKSNTMLPSKEQLDEAIRLLLSGEAKTEIVLDDWGVGSTKFHET